MDFARQQLEKYGWKDGEGLGRTKTGISKPVKAKLKFDNAGLGHNLADELVNPWWQRVYDTAAGNLQVSKEDNSVKIETAEVTEVTTKKRKKKKLVKTELAYGNFVKRAALTAKGEQVIGSDYESSDDEPKIKKKTSGICDLTDEELFKACGGRTAHKGARHGLSMSAKLERSRKLEEMELEKLKALVDRDAEEPKKKKKKKKKSKQKE